MGNVENVENNKNAKFIDKNIKHIKYLECRKLSVKKNKDNVNNYARANYLKKLNDYGDEYRTKLNTKNRETRNLKKEQRIQDNPDLIIKIGRPKNPIPNVIPEKKLMDDLENLI